MGLTPRYRTILLVLLFLAAPVLAGCTTPEPADPGPGGGDSDDGDAGQGDGADTGGSEQFTPPPASDGLSSEEIQGLVDAFDDSALVGGQEPWPEHLIKWVNEDVFVFLHFDAEDPAEATHVNWVGIGLRSVFCAETQPSEDWTHFHGYDAPEYQAGHGGEAGREGYWLLHIAARDFQSPFGMTDVGVHDEFGPTPPPTCGDDVPEPTFQPADADGLDAQEVQALNAALDDEPLIGGQDPWPEHMITWVNEDVFFFLHFDAEDPAESTNVRWMGLGLRSNFCQETQPDAGWTHFHGYESETYQGGHGGQAGRAGYWLLHVAADSFESPFGPTEPGVHHDFGPTPPPEC